MIPEGRLSYLLNEAEEKSRDSDVTTRHMARGMQEVIEELRRMYERAQTVEGVLSDAIATGKPLGILKVHEALRGPEEAPATTEELVLWAKYFSNDENAVKGWSMPQAGFRDKYKMLALRCNYCAYLSGGLVHANWHEAQPGWATKNMLEERKEKLG